MIGKQFTYYCFPEDLEEIESKVFTPANARVFIDNSSPNQLNDLKASKFSLPRSEMGNESLFLLLLPPHQLEKLHHSVFNINSELSNVIEINRCYINNGVIQPGRFWYAPKTYANREPVDKPTEFLAWAQSIFRNTKSLLVSHELPNYPNVKSLFGKVAWEHISSGEIIASLN